MKPIHGVLRATVLAVVLAACSGDSGTDPEPLPDPFMSVALTGAIADSSRGTPHIRWGWWNDKYEFEIFSEVRHSDGVYQELSIRGEGRRPRVGTYPITVWREGPAGTRTHATFSRDSPGGGASYHAVSGELRITRSTREGFMGEFTFHGVPGYLLPDRAVLSPEYPPVQVRGTFSVRCEVNEACR